MQKLYSTGGSVKCHLEKATAFITQWGRVCPWCEDRHRLWSHGQYDRRVRVPIEGVVCVVVFRFLCPRQGATVSLLPDFCIPRRQYGAVPVGIFLEAHVLDGCSVPNAMKRTTTGDSWGQSVAPAQVRMGRKLRQRFLERLPKIQTYVGACQQHFKEYVSPIGSRFNQAATVLQVLRRNGDSLGQAFLSHGPRLLADCHCTWV